MSVTRAPISIEAHFFGGFSMVGVDAERVAELARQPKRIAMLALLASAPAGQTVRRETIAALLWPEADRERARASVRNALYQIRSILDADVVARSGDESLILDRSLVDDDLALLERAVAAGDDAAAITVYRAPFLDGFHLAGAGMEWEEWVEHTRRRLAAAAQRAGWRRADRLERVGDALGALHAARWAITIAGLDELSYRRAIELALRVGDRAAALGTYAELARRLARDFEVSPSPETTRLVAGLRVEGAAGALPAARSASEPSRSTPPGGGTPRGAAPGAARAWTAGLARPVLIGLAAGVGVLAIVPVVRRMGVAREEPMIEATWTPVGGGLPTRPGARANAAYAVDSAGGILQFGGVQDASGDPSDFRIENDLWQLINATSPGSAEWRKEAPAGAPPRARWIARMVGDPRHDRVYVFGGAHGTTSPCANDTWVVEGASSLRAPPRWRQVRAADAPPPRADYSAALDTASGTLLVFGGHDCIRRRFGDVWALGTGDAEPAWRQLHPDGALGTPSPRSSSAYAWDPVGRRLLIFGGHDDRVTVGGLWELSVGPSPRWRLLRCGGTEPPPITGGMAAYDPRRDRLILVGGVTADSRSLANVWVMSGSRGGECRWQTVVVRGDGIPARGYGLLTWDERAQMAIAVGGIVANSGLNDVWQLRLRDLPDGG